MRKAEDFIQMIEDRIPVHAHLGMTKERYLIGITTACIEIIAEVLEEVERSRSVTTIPTAELAELREKAAMYDGLCK